MSWLLYIICCAILSIVVLFSVEQAYKQAKNNWGASRSLEKRDESIAHKMTAQVIAETDGGENTDKGSAELDDYANSLIKQL